MNHWGEGEMKAEYSEDELKAQCRRGLVRQVEYSEDELKAQRHRGLVQQITMCLFANVSILGPAMSMGYSAVILPTLRSETSDIKITASQASWIAGGAAFGTPLGCILSSLVMRRGRRLSLLVTSTFSLIGWLLIYMSTNYQQLVVGRIVSGFATGLASVPSTVYTGEIATPAWRGTMVTWTSICIALGIELVYIFGYFFQGQWKMLALMCSVFPAASVILTIVAIPESPLWLRDRGRLDEARVVMKKFRGIPKEHPTPAHVENELKRPEHYFNTKKKSPIKHLTKRSSLVPFGILLGFFFFQQFSGIFVVVFYAVDIATEAGVQMDAYVGAILIGLTRILGSILVAAASKKWGRRFPSIVSGAGMAISMGMLSLYLFLRSRGQFNDPTGLTPAVCLLAYIFVSTTGFLSLPFAMISEMYPAKVKDILSGLTVCIAYIFSFITIKIYPDSVILLGNHGVFMFYAIVALVGTVFVVVFLPETKGKTLHEIEELFSKKRKIINDYQDCDVLEKEKTVPLKDISTIDA